MAAKLLISNSYPHNDEVTLSATPNTMQELSVPGNARRIEIRFVANDGKILTAGTDAVVITTEKDWGVDADSPWYYDYPRSKGTHPIFVASAVASTVVKFFITDVD
jgi:hypothetical protein